MTLCRKAVWRNGWFACLFSLQATKQTRPNWQLDAYALSMHLWHPTKPARLPLFGLASFSMSRYATDATNKQALVR